MPFILPTFNLDVNVFSNGDPTQPPRLTCKGNLAWGRRVGQPTVGGDPIGSVFDYPGTMTLLVPLGTDIRDIAAASGFDVVEVPAGSGRTYRVLSVDELGGGFANEHRGAVLSKFFTATSPWPTPFPGCGGGPSPP